MLTDFRCTFRKKRTTPSIRFYENVYSLIFQTCLLAENDCIHKAEIFENKQFHKPNALSCSFLSVVKPQFAPVRAPVEFLQEI